MRDIKFRAKHFDTGQWVYGSFIQESLVHGSIFYIHSMSNDEEEGDMKHRIDYKTLGEFTGRTDKNGKEIYEGDIIQLFRHDDIHHKHMPVTSWVDGKRVLDKHVVKFINGTFCIWSHLIKDHRAFMHLMRPGESLEVRGNIYDNLTLLEPKPTVSSNSI